MKGVNKKHLLRNFKTSTLRDLFVKKKLGLIKETRNAKQQRLAKNKAPIQWWEQIVRVQGSSTCVRGGESF